VPPSLEPTLPPDTQSAPRQAEAPVEPSVAPLALPVGVPPVSRRYGNQAFLAVFLIGIVLFLLTVLPILPPILLGGLLAAFATPLRRRIEEHFTSSRVAAAAITALIILVVLAPITFLVALVVERLIAVVGRLPELLAWIDSSDGLQRYLADNPFLQKLMPSDLGGQLQGAVTWVGGAIPQVLTSFLDLAMAFFLTIPGAGLGRRVGAHLHLADGPRAT
jgi:predicted PurR-regulated permease PerM